MMPSKLIVDCLNNEVVEKPFTSEEIARRDLEQRLAAEQELLNNLIPTEKDMLMAEVEIQTITILMEVGLI